MGNYRFRLSDMIPNAWFYKLKDMGKTRKQTPTTHSRKKKQPSPASTQKASKPKQPHQYNLRKSYYFTRELTPNDRIYSSPTLTNNQNAKYTNSFEPPRKSCNSRNSNRFVSLFLFDAYSQTYGAHNLSQLQTHPIPHPPTYQNHWNKINEIENKHKSIKSTEPCSYKNEIKIKET